MFEIFPHLEVLDGIDKEGAEVLSEEEEYDDEEEYSDEYECHFKALARKSLLSSKRKKSAFNTESNLSFYQIRVE